MNVDTTTITDAIRNGHDDVFRIASALGVRHTDYRLRSTLAAMIRTGFVGRTDSGKKLPDGRTIYRLGLTDPTAYPDEQVVQADRAANGNAVPLLGSPQIDPAPGGAPTTDVAVRGPYPPDRYDTPAAPPPGTAAYEAYTRAERAEVARVRMSAALTDHMSRCAACIAGTPCRKAVRDWENLTTADLAVDDARRAYHRAQNADAVDRTPPAGASPGSVANDPPPATVARREQDALPVNPDPHAPGGTLDVERQIRRAYTDLCNQGTTLYGATRPDSIVRLADVRAALPDDVPREVVDLALARVAMQDDVNLFPLASRKNTTPDDQAAAVTLGVGYSDAMRVDPMGLDLDTIHQGIRTAGADMATSMVDPLGDQTSRDLAARMGVDPTGSLRDVKQRIVERSDANCQAWHTEARQSELDGTLLYRADNEPDWVATWTAADYAAAGAAAGRVLSRCDRDPETWHDGFRDRARRWVDAAPGQPLRR